MKRFEYVNLPDLSQLDAVAPKGGGAILKAGGVDLLGRIKDRLIAPARLVNLQGLSTLREIRSTKDGMRIGALATLADVAAHPDLRKTFPALCDAAGQAATPQVRNQATIGGNLLQRPRCWYFRNPDLNCRKKGGTECLAQEGENRYHAIFGNQTCAIVHPSNVAVPLVALEAVLVLVGASGERQVPLEEFLTPPEADVTRENGLKDGEVLTEIRIPEKGWQSRYAEVRERQAFDWPLVSAAIAARHTGSRFEAVRVVAGAVAPIPWRLRKVEEALLKTNTHDESAWPKLAEMAGDGARPLAQNGFKLVQLKTLVRRLGMSFHAW